MMTCETPNDLLDPFYPDGNFILNMTDIEQTYPLDIKISTISISLQTGIHLFTFGSEDYNSFRFQMIMSMCMGIHA